jgi:DMSO reductase iron-sulfur subunit
MMESMPDGPRGFLFDPNRCTGCSACVLACSTENELDWGTSWRKVVPFNETRRPGVPAFHLSLACNHCDEAPCVEQCPAVAIRRDATTGAVLIHEDHCIGCGYCGWVCPYDAPLFDEARSVMTKCTLCNHRLLDGLAPACVESCPTSALGFGAPRGEQALPGFPDTDALPRIRFATLRRGASPPESTWEVPREVLTVYEAARAGPHSRRLSLRAELPLWLFTTGAAGLVGWVVAGAMGSVEIPLGLFVSLALGSREVVAYSAFVGLSATWLAMFPGMWLVGSVAAAVGLVALFTMDRVYDPVRPPNEGVAHSADVLLTGPLFAAALLRSPVAFSIIAVLKAFLFAGRSRRRRTRSRWEVSLSVLRVGVGLALPPLLWTLSPELWAGAGLLIVGIAEMGDRAMFYRELEVSTPRSVAEREAVAWVADVSTDDPGPER